MTDSERLAAAVASMRQPQLRMHPDDLERLVAALPAAPDDVRAACIGVARERLAFSGLDIVADPEVPRGQMRVVDAAPPVPKALTHP